MPPVGSTSRALERDDFDLSLFALIEFEALFNRIVPGHLGDKKADAGHRILRRKISNEFADAFFFTFLEPA